MSRTVIRRYDKNRICILPMYGIPERAAEWMTEYALKKELKDFKIVQTTEEPVLLGIVCKPKTWYFFVKAMRNLGIGFDEGFEDQFLEASAEAMKEGVSMVDKKGNLSKKDEKWLNDALKKIEQRGMTKEEDEKMDAEIEEDLKEQEAKGELYDESERNQSSTPK